jgi:hypothetical protein
LALNSFNRGKNKGDITQKAGVMKTFKIALLMLGALLLTYCQDSPLEVTPSEYPDNELFLKDHHVHDGCVFVQKLWAGAGQCRPLSH